jgi:hypothetical protein
VAILHLKRSEITEFGEKQPFQAGKLH